MHGHALRVFRVRSASIQLEFVCTSFSDEFPNFEDASETSASLGAIGRRLSRLMCKRYLAAVNLHALSHVDEASLTGVATAQGRDAINSYVTSILGAPINQYVAQQINDAKQSAYGAFARPIVPLPHFPQGTNLPPPGNFFTFTSTQGTVNDPPKFFSSFFSAYNGTKFASPTFQFASLSAPANTFTSFGMSGPGTTYVQGSGTFVNLQAPTAGFGNNQFVSSINNVVGSGNIVGINYNSVLSNVYTSAP